MDQQETTRAAQHGSFQQHLEDELEALQRDLEEYVQERQPQGEEIVAALIRYNATDTAESVDSELRRAADARRATLFRGHCLLIRDDAS